MFTHSVLVKEKHLPIQSVQTTCNVDIILKKKTVLAYSNLLPFQ